MTARRGSEPDNIYLALVPVLDTRQPNFRSAGWRAVEAAECLKEIIEAIPALHTEWKGYPAVRGPRSTPDQLEVSLIDWEWSHLPTARKLTMLASEVLHHARIALDYCAFHMVWKDGGVPRDGTHFPLLKDPAKWSKEKRKALPGITDEHANWVRDVQPFNAVPWSAALLELSNRDKHRLAVDVVPTYRCRVDRSRRYGDPLGDSAYWGYKVEDTELELNIAPAMKSDQDVPATLHLEKTLASIVMGVVSLVNKFLKEAGISEIDLILIEASSTKVSAPTQSSPLRDP